MIQKLYALRWWMISLITIGTILNYLTRTTLGVAAPDDSWVTRHRRAGIFLDHGSLPGRHHAAAVRRLRDGSHRPEARLRPVRDGVGADHDAPRRGATNWQMLAALRGLMGFAEGSAQPGGMKAVAEWFPAKERGFAGGFYNIGASFGSMLAAPLVAWAILFHSWRLAFVIAGALALVWVACGSAFTTRPKIIRRSPPRNATTSSPARKRTWRRAQPSRRS